MLGSKLKTDNSSFLAVVGVIPPPFGGVSVHVKRYMDLLTQANIEATLYEQTGKSDPDNGVVPFTSSSVRFVKFLLTFKEDVVHFHFNNHRALAIAGQLLRLRKGKKIILTIHSEKLVRWYDEKGWLYRRTISDCFRRADHLICVSQPISDFMSARLGIDKNKLSVIPAFLPPTEEEKSEHHIPKEVGDFIAGREKVIGTHGWFGYFVDGNHVYGFDHIAQLAQEISDSQRNIAMYTVISGNYEDAHRDKIKALQEKLSGNWMIVESPFSCAALYEKTDMFIRPTVTDGDSVSIRECLSTGVPVLASDAVPRPKQCQLYKSRDYPQLSKSFWSLVDQSEIPALGESRCIKTELISVIQANLRSN